MGVERQVQAEQKEGSFSKRDNQLKVKLLESKSTKGLDDVEVGLLIPELDVRERVSFSEEFFEL